MVVVLPTPFTPTTIITYGSPFVSGNLNSPGLCVLFSSNKEEISSFKTRFNSEVFKYLSRAIRASMRSITFNVVSTPTSDVIRISSKLSSTSSSTVDLPTIVRAILEKKLCFVFSNPLLSVSFLSLENNPKNAIVLKIEKAPFGKRANH